MMQLAPRPEARYRNLTQAFRTIAATESPRVLFRGIGVVAMGAGPAHAMYFSLYEISKKSLSSKYNGFLSQGIIIIHPPYVLYIYCLFVGGAAVIATMAHDGFMNPVEGTGNKYGNINLCVKLLISKFVLVLMLFAVIFMKST